MFKCSCPHTYPHVINNHFSPTINQHHSFLFYLFPSLYHPIIVEKFPKSSFFFFLPFNIFPISATCEASQKGTCSLTPLYFNIYTALFILIVNKKSSVPHSSHKNTNVVFVVLFSSVPRTNMASISQGLAVTTAMVLSTTVLYLAFSKQNISPPFQIPSTPNSPDPNKQILRSCLYSGKSKFISFSIPLFFLLFKCSVSSLAFFFFEENYNFLIFYFAFVFSEEKKRERKKKKKKRVKFSENVMVKEEEVRDNNITNKENREEQGKKQNRASIKNNKCRNETTETRGSGMPANRIALYNGILRDRVHRMACCH